MDSSILYVLKKHAYNSVIISSFPIIQKYYFIFSPEERNIPEISSISLEYIIRFVLVGYILKTKNHNTQQKRVNKKLCH